jgi:hypothetical protein
MDYWVYLYFNSVSHIWQSKPYVTTQKNAPFNHSIGLNDQYRYFTSLQYGGWDFKEGEETRALLSLSSRSFYAFQITILPSTPLARSC